MWCCVGDEVKHDNLVSNEFILQKVCSLRYAKMKDNFDPLFSTSI